MRNNPAVKIFSGIQPTGEPHIGNYSGGFRQYAKTQEEGEAYFCIVDLHAITVEFDPAELREATLDIAAMLFATGLDAERSTVFVQSQVTAHAEAAWLLGAATWLWTNTVERSGSSPVAKSIAARSSVERRRFSGSYVTVIECRSTMQKNASPPDASASSCVAAYWRKPPL